jgi:hypothetical protein
MFVHTEGKHFGLQTYGSNEIGYLKKVKTVNSHKKYYKISKNITYEST